MSEITRGVFALIMNVPNKSILLSERADGKGWNLPGGGVEEGETDQQALVREVFEETSLRVIVGPKVGEDHVFKNDAAAAYICFCLDDSEPQTTNEAMTHRYVDADQLKTLKLVGPEGRLGRTGRMAWDGITLLQTPCNKGESSIIPKEASIINNANRTELIYCDEMGRSWHFRQLDPFEPSGEKAPS